MEKIFINSTALRCENNAYLTSRIKNFLIINNYRITHDIAEANTIIITTCGFRQQERDNSYEYIQKTSQLYPDKRIIISGCLVDIMPQLQQDNRLICVGPTKPEILNTLFAYKICYQDIKNNIIEKNFLLDAQDDQFWIQIAQGCANSCSYCVVKKAKKYVVSRPISEIITEVKEGIKLNKKKIILLADDCGSYGLDINTDFSILLNAITNIPELHNSSSYIYISSFEPHRLELLFSKIKKSLESKRIGHISIDIQSGSDRIINLMNRKYTLSQIIKIVSVIRKISPTTTVDTEIIFCFPTETRQDFLQSVKVANFFKDVLFLKYSANPGTAIEELGIKIEEEECAFRVKFLQKIIASGKSGFKLHL